MLQRNLVLQVHADSPASRAGLSEGCVLRSINGASTAHQSHHAILSMLQGTLGPAGIVSITLEVDEKLPRSSALWTRDKARDISQMLLNHGHIHSLVGPASVFEDSPRSRYRFAVDRYDVSPYELSNFSMAMHVDCNVDEREHVRSQVCFMEELG